MMKVSVFVKSMFYIVVFHIKDQSLEIEKLTSLQFLEEKW